MTYEQAEEKAKNMVKQKEYSGRILFIMGKNNDFEVIVGWNGRDEALKKGYVFPRYSISKSEWVTEYDEITSGKF